MAAPTPEERQAQRLRRYAETVRLQQRANQLIADIETGEDWRAWLELGARFAGHGLRNALLIPDQWPGATHVATYETWQARGRNVQRGHHGIRILDPETLAPKSVFDISQTSGQPWEPAQHSFDAEHHLWPALDQLAQRHGHVVHLNGSLDDGAVTALVHELAHVLLGTAAQACHGARHLEAESVAFLIGRHIGIDTSPITFPGVRTWAGELGENRLGVIRAFATRVDEATKRIRAHLDACLPVAGPALHRALRSLPPELVALHQLAHRYYLDQMPRGWAPHYLAERGFPPAVQSQWGLGWAPPGWDSLLERLRSHGYRDDLIEAAGLAHRTKRGNLIDFFRDRVMIPVRAPDGIIIAFVGRAPDDAPSGTPKYLNSPETAIYHKSESLIGLYEARPRLQQGALPTLVEGGFDAIAVAMASDRYAPVAPSGTALTEHQCQLLAECTPHLERTGIAVALDGDASGRRAAVKAYDRLAAITYELTAIEFTGNDPAGLLHRHSPEHLATTLHTKQRPLIDLVIDHHIAQWRRRLDTAEGQVAALRAIAPTIAALPPHQVAGRVAYLSHQLGIPHSETTQAVTDAASPSPNSWNDAPRELPDLTTPVVPSLRPLPGAETSSPRRKQR